MDADLRPCLSFFYSSEPGSHVDGPDGFQSLSTSGHHCLLPVTGTCAYWSAVSVVNNQCCRPIVGVRLYKETPAEPPLFPSPSKPSKGAKDQVGAKGKGPKGRGKKAKKQGGLGGSLVAPRAEPSWELLAGSTDELQAVGEDLTGQQANAEADIGYQVILNNLQVFQPFAGLLIRSVPVLNQTCTDLKSLSCTWESGNAARLHVFDVRNSTRSCIFL